MVEGDSNDGGGDQIKVGFDDEAEVMVVMVIVMVVLIMIVLISMIVMMLMVVTISTKLIAVMMLLVVVVISLLVCREYLHVFIVLHRAHSRLLVSIQRYFDVVIKITKLH